MKVKWMKYKITSILLYLLTNNCKNINMLINYNKVNLGSKFHGLNVIKERNYYYYLLI